MGERIELLRTAIDAHGGIGRWQSVRQVVVRVRAGGLALKARFQPKAFGDVEATVSTSIPKSLFNPYPRKGLKGVFEAGAVGIIDDQGRLIGERKKPRAGFSRFRRKVYWDDLDTLYFGGYALWNYLNLPFLLIRPGVEVNEIEPWGEMGERLRRLRVTFPGHIPSHCAEQIFYFAPSGLLVRHDYTADVFGGWARAAHYSWNHREFDGIVFPTQRRVFPRLPSGRPLRQVTLVSLKIDNIRIIEDDT